MSNAHFGRVVPVSLRKFSRIECSVFSENRRASGVLVPLQRIAENLRSRLPFRGAAEGDPSSTADDIASSSTFSSTPVSSASAASLSSSGSTTSSSSSSSLFSATTTSSTKKYELPRDLPAGVHLVVFLTRLKHVYHLDTWISLRHGLDILVKRRGEELRRKLGGGGGGGARGDRGPETDEEHAASPSVSEQDDSIASSSTKNYTNEKEPASSPETMTTSSSNTKPSTNLPVNTLSSSTSSSQNSNRIAIGSPVIANPYPTDLSAEGKNEMGMYIICMLPIFPPLRLLWRFCIHRWRKKMENFFRDNTGVIEDDMDNSWYRQLQMKRAGADAETIQQNVVKSTFLTSLTWKSAYFQRMHLHEDGRAWGFLVKNDGEILWASDETFEDEAKFGAQGRRAQEAMIRRAVDEEFTFRETRWSRLLEAGSRAGETKLLGNGNKTD
ncbi:unnamed protein product [Amoebophrya sp. A25]|nr:unnamed protein product [Amoebophrya sp. A25]|eukprot:GSA25T00017885001.1